jgi:hypothetical protein
MGKPRGRAGLEQFPRWSGQEERRAYYSLVLRVFKALEKNRVRGVRPPE